MLAFVITPFMMLWLKCCEMLIERCQPALLPVNEAQLPKSTNTAADARLDVSARSLWNPLERAFLDIYECFTL